MPTIGTVVVGKHRGEGGRSAPVVIWEVEEDDHTIEGLDENGRPDPAYAAALGLLDAPLGRRAAAAAVDIVGYLLLQLPYQIFGLPLLLSLLQGRISWYGFVNHPQFILALVMTGVTFVLTLAYCIVQLVTHGRRGATLGKKLMGIRSVNVKTLERPGFWRMLLRSLVLWASAIVVLGPVIFFLSPLFDNEKRSRGWHDKVGQNWYVDIRHGLQPYDDKRMRVARKMVKAEPIPKPKALPSLATQDGGAQQEAYRPGGRVSAGVLGVARPHGAGPRPVVGLSGQETSEPVQEEPTAATPGQPVLGGYRPGDRSVHEDMDMPAGGSLSTRSSAPSPAAPPSSGQPAAAQAQGGQAPPTRPHPGASAPVDAAGTLTPAPRTRGPEQSARQRVPTAGDTVSTDETVRHPGSAASPAPAQPTQAPAFVLELDTGERIAVAAGVVVGRNPTVPEGAVGASRLPVADSTRSVSKTHLGLRPIQGGLEVTDFRSTNGTFIVHAGAERTLAPWEPELAVPGDTVRFGDRTAVVARA